MKFNSKLLLFLQNRLINLTGPKTDRMKNLALILLLSFSLAKSYAQPAIQWEHAYGGSDQDAANCIRQTSDSGYIVAGYSISTDGDVTGGHGSYDYWVVKLSRTGSIQWEKTYGGSDQDLANCIQQTTDGGYIVAGRSRSTNGDVTGNHGMDDYWIVKLSSTGALQWQKSFGGSSNDAATSIQQTTDGGYIVAGYSNSFDGDITSSRGMNDYWMVKLTSTGTMVWQKSFGGTSSSFLN